MALQKHQYVVLIAVVTVITLLIYSNQQRSKFIYKTPEKEIPSFASLTFNHSPFTSESPSTTASTTTRSRIPPSQAVKMNEITRYLTVHPLDGSAGRLGNFCYRYAAAMGIAKANRMLLVLPDTDLVRHMRTVFNISTPLITEMNLSYSNSNFTAVQEKHWGVFDRQMFALPLQANISLNWAYTQSFKYFDSTEQLVRKELTFTQQIHDKVERFISGVRSRYSPHYVISLHVRRGDFLKESHQQFGYAIAPKEFFSNATKYYTSKYGTNLVFIVGTDDRLWCQNELEYNGAKGIFAPNESADEDLATLVACDHHIVSVGSFGWWSGWLGKGDVVYFKGFPTPGSRHSTNHNPLDYYPPTWVGFG